MTAMYALWHKPQGLIAISSRIRFRTEVLRDEFKQLDIKSATHPNNFFDTITVDCKASGFSSADYLISEFHKYDINLRKVNDDQIGITLNETTTIDDLATLIEVFAYLKDQSLEIGDYCAADRFEEIKFRGIPADLASRTDFMQ